MLYTKIQPQSSQGSEKNIRVLPYMGMGAIFNGAEPFEQMVNTMSTEGPVRKLLKRF